MKLYDKNAVAKFLDMTPKNVERLTQKGILQTKQGNLYALAETNRAYIKYLRDRNPESQEAVDLNEERAKLTKTKRLNEELDLAVKKGELHRSEDIEKVMTAWPGSQFSVIVIICSKVIASPGARTCT